LAIVKATPLLAVPLTVTTTFTEPFAIPDGTVAAIDVLLQLVVAATTVPNLTVLDPLVDPKLLPVMVTDTPVAPEVGFRLEMTGAANREPLARTTKAKTATARRDMRVLRNEDSV
jgi:hypothetical protein